MSKVFNLKLAVMGFVSSTCLIGAANAEVGVTGAVVELKQIGHHHEDGILPVACGTEEFTVKYKLKNISDDPATITSVDTIVINPGDHFFLDPENETVTVLPPDDKDDCGYKLPFTLAGDNDDDGDGESCYIHVQINPESHAVQALCEDNVFDPAIIIDRTLDVEGYVDFGGATAPITFPITTLGAAETLSILGNNICDESESSNILLPCDNGDSSLNAGFSTVEQNVAVYGWGNGLLNPDGYITPSLSGYPHAYDGDDRETDRFIDDSEAAYNNLLAMASDVCSGGANQYPAYLTSNQTVPPTIEIPVSQAIEIDGAGEGMPTFICTDTHDITQIDNTITLDGAGIYVFVINPILPVDPDDFISLNFLANADMELTCIDDSDPTTCAESGDVFWVVNGQMEVDPTSPDDNDNPVVDNLYGSFLLKGGLEFDTAMNTGTNIIGRILSFDGENVILDGTTVTAPEDEDDTTVPDSI